MWHKWQRPCKDMRSWFFWNPWSVDQERFILKKKETKGGEKIDILKLEYCVTLKLIRPVAQLFMVDVLLNGVHEHVTIC